MNGRRFVAGLALVLLVACSGQLWAGQYATILHFNDFHGHLQPTPPDENGHSTEGLARLAGMVEQTRAWNKGHHVPTLLLEGGDMLQGTPLSMIYHGEPDFTCLNMMGVDAMAVGNHEFDFGLPNLLVRISQAKFPVLSANVTTTADGKLLAGARPYVLRELGDETAAIIGLTTPETKVESAAENVADVDFAEPVATLRKLLPELTSRAESSWHSRTWASRRIASWPRPSRRLMSSSAAIAIPPFSRRRSVGQTVICQAGSYCRYLGQFDAYIENGEITKYRGFLRPVDETAPVRADIAGVIESYAVKLRAELAEVVGETAVPLQGEREIIRIRETNLGDLIADAIRDYAKADMTLTNGGGIRSSIDAGPITVGEVLTVLPFNNEIAVVKLTGQQVMQVLQHNASLPIEDGGFLQVSGISFTIYGNEVQDVKVGGETLDPRKVYEVATNAFLMTGGNGYETFAEGNDLRMLGFTISNVFVDYLKAHPTVSPEVEGRITVKR